MISAIDEKGNYWITKSGRLYSVKRPKSYKRWLTPKTDRYGYLNYAWHEGGKRKHRTVHRLLAEAFIPNPDNLPQINHKDGDKLNNDLSNLEWVSAKDNTKHAWDSGLCKAYDRTEPYNRQGIIDSNKRRASGI